MRYEDSDRKLKDFMDKHEQLFEEFYRLVEQRNNACDESHDLVKRSKTSCGRFEYRPATTVSYDVDALKEKLPRSLFSRVTKVSIDRKALDILVERGEIKSEDISDACSQKVIKKCFGPKTWRLS